MSYNRDTFHSLGIDIDWIKSGDVHKIITFYSGNSTFFSRAISSPHHRYAYRRLRFRESPGCRGGAYPQSIQITKEGNLYVAGWAIEKSVGAPVKEVSIYTEDELLGKASLGRPRPDVANHFRSPVYLNSGWEFNGGKLVLTQISQG